MDVQGNSWCFCGRMYDNGVLSIPVSDDVWYNAGAAQQNRSRQVFQAKLSAHVLT